MEIKVKPITDTVNLSKTLNMKLEITLSSGNNKVIRRYSISDHTQSDWNAVVEDMKDTLAELDEENEKPM